MPNNDQPTFQDGDEGNTLPTTFVNRFFYRGGPGATRLAFGEVFDPSQPTNWHFAFIMDNQNLIQLAHMILSQANLTHPEQQQTNVVQLQTEK